MDANKQYKCVNCGEPTAALYKTYGPSVLKLTKCEKCNGIVDKYIEYDPVIVMIDLVLVSREAQRHVLYNTEFKSYWKLLIILLMIETYGLWQSKSLFNVAVNTLCGIQTNSSTLNTTELSYLLPLDFQVPESFKNHCWGWMSEARDDEIYLWEEDFYVMFISTFAGVVVFVTTMHIAMKVLQAFITLNTAGVPALLRACALAQASALLRLPAAAWRGARAAHHALGALYSFAVFLNTLTAGVPALLRACALAQASALLRLPAAAWRGARAAHHALGALYSFAVFLNTLTVVYECPMLVTTLVLAVSNLARFLTTYHTAPLTRELLRQLRDQDIELLKDF